MRTTLARAAAIVSLAALTAVSALAQRREFGGHEGPSGNPRYNGRFTFARIKYDVGPGGYYYRGLPAWAHGEPFAETNLLKIVDAISLLRPRIDEGVVVALDDPELFKFPVAYLTEAGFWTLSDEEAAAFRAYLQKGGFVIFDDFRGPGPIPWGGGWENFAANMEKVLPGVRILPLDVSHPVFHSFFEIASLDSIPEAYDQDPEIRGIFENNDPSKRLMAVVNFNMDMADFWEFSGRGYYPVDASNENYKLGVNYIFYGLTH